MILMSFNIYDLEAFYVGSCHIAVRHNGKLYMTFNELYEDSLISSDELVMLKLKYGDIRTMLRLRHGET